MRSNKERPTLTEYLRRLDCHGVNWTLAEDNFLFRVLWISLIIGTICVTIFYCSSLISEFNQSPVIRQATEVNVDKLQYPNVLICNPEIVNYTKLLEDQFPQQVLDIVFDFYFTNYDYRAFGRIKRKRDMYDEATSDEFVRNFLEKFSMHEFLTKYGYKCEEILLRCLVNNLWEDNCCVHTKPVFHALHGHCYLLHSNRWNQSHVSPTAGITLTTASLSSNPTNVTNYPPLKHGVYMEMLETYEYASNVGYYFEPNHTVVLSLKRTTYDRSKASNIGCLNADEADFTSSAICQNICWIRQYQANCNCTKSIGYYPITNRTNVPFCQVLDAMSCLAESLSQYNENYIKCLTDFCKPLCQENVYRATATVSALKTSQIECYKPKNMTNFNGFVMINIIFHAMIYEKVIEIETLTLHSVISLLGGQIGLWFGGSVITIMQAIIIAIVIVKRKFYHLQNVAELKQPKMKKVEINQIENILAIAGENPLKTLRSLALHEVLAQEIKKIGLK